MIYDKDAPLLVTSDSVRKFLKRKQNSLWHGGVSGLLVGDLIKPNMAEHRYVKGCPHCEAQRAGILAPGFDPPTPKDYVYATSDREYARYYASRAVKGTLYRVDLFDPVPSVEDPFPTWRGPVAKVLEVKERNIVLTMCERKRLWIRWGGTAEEFELRVQMILGRMRL